MILAALSFAGAPLAVFLFGSLPSRGLFLAKPLGLLAFGYCAWLLLFTRLFPNSRGYMIVLLAIVLAAAALSLAIWPKLGRDLRAGWKSLVAAEAVFAAAFLVFLIYRAHNPDIAATEKPMDFALMNGILRSSSFPPSDPWLAGFSINYYYFGYSLAAALTSLGGTAPEVGFNLALGATFALSFLGVFSIGFDLARLTGAPGRLAPAGVGAFTAVLAMVGGNLFAIRHYFDGEFRNQDFWRGIGWNASRVIQVKDASGLRDYTINEFPAFSFILGDMHPHVMALPFTIAAISLAVAWLSEWSAPQTRTRSLLAFSALSGWLLGSLYALNAWDFPAFFVLVALAGFVGLVQGGRIRLWREYVLHAVLAAAVGIFAFVPFHLTFRPFASGFGLVAVRSELVPFLTVYGFWVVAAFGLVAVALVRGATADRWLAIGASVYLVLLWILQPGVSVLALLLLLVVAMAGLLGRWAGEGGRTAVPLLLLAGFGLAAVPEVVFIRDFFGPPYQRMNTVFKIYYQAWPILVAASGPAIYSVFRSVLELNGQRRSWSALSFAAPVAFLLFIAMSYPLLAGRAKAQSAPTPTLDGLAFARSRDPREIEAVEWLRRNAPTGAVLVEAAGKAYTDYGRISAWTGIPTVIGWDQHEELWRGSRAEVDGRVRDVDALFARASPEEALGLLRRYQVNYVFVGRLEREKYGAQVADRFGWLPVAHAVPGAFTIYAVPKS